VDIDLVNLVPPELLAQYKNPLDARSRHLKAKKRAERREEAKANLNSYGTLQPEVDDVGYVVASDPNAFPDILPRSEPLDSSGDNSEPQAIYGFSPSNSPGNWAAMASRTRDSASEWHNQSNSDYGYVRRPQRTLGDDIDQAISESILSLSALDLENSDFKKNGKKGGKKKLVLLSSNRQRRR